MLKNDTERREYIDNDDNWETVGNMLDSRLIIDHLGYRGLDFYRVMIKELIYNFNTVKEDKVVFRCRCYLYSIKGIHCFDEVGKSTMISMLKDADLRDKNNG